MLPYVCCAPLLSHVWLFATPWTTRLLCPWHFQARILEWVAVSSSRGASQPRDRTLICCISGNIHWQVDSLPLNHLGGCHTPLTIVFFLMSNVLGPLSSLVWAFHSSGFPQKFPFFGLARLTVLPTWALTLTIKTQHGWHFYGII